MRTNFVSYSSAVGRARFHIALIPKYRHKIFGYERIKTFCARRACLKINSPSSIL